jgi:hypothetical protein
VRKQARIIITPMGTPTEAPIADPSCFEDGFDGPATVVGPKLAIATPVVERVEDTGVDGPAEDARVAEDARAAATAALVAAVCAIGIEVEFNASSTTAVLSGTWLDESGLSCGSFCESSLSRIEATSNTPIEGDRRKNSTIEYTKQ